jgi:hypothetical protein
MPGKNGSRNFPSLIRIAADLEVEVILIAAD